MKCESYNIFVVNRIFTYISNTLHADYGWEFGSGIYSLDTVPITAQLSQYKRALHR